MELVLRLLVCTKNNFGFKASYERKIRLKTRTFVGYKKNKDFCSILRLMRGPGENDFVSISRL